MDYTAQISALKAASDQVDKLTADLQTALTTYQGTERELTQAKAAWSAANDALNTAQATAGTVGTVSSIDQALQAERFAGKAASVDYIKANPTCTEADAIAAWTTAGLAATGLPALIVPAESYAALYRANLAKMGLTPDATWESQRAWIVATDKATIMGA